MKGRSNSRKTRLQKKKHFFTLLCMWNKWDKTIFALATIAFITIAFVSSANADEKMSSIQTALDSTTVSGYVQVDASVQPVLPISAANLSSQSLSVELSMARPQGAQMIPNYVLGSSFGAEIISPSPAYRLQLPPISPPSVIELQFNQPGIQPVPTPEPSTLALGGLALGLTAFARLNRRKRI